MQDRSLGWEDPLEERMATHSSVPAWRMPQTEQAMLHSVTQSDTTEATQHTQHIFS